MIKQYDVLDKGYVKLLKVYGNERDILENAYICSKNEYESKSIQQLENTLKMLIDKNHGSTFEQVLFKMEIKLPIFVQRHFAKYRMQSYNELSARYTDFSNIDYYIPSLDNIYDQVLKSKSIGLIINHTENSIDLYKKLLKLPIYNNKEIARDVLPVNIYTTTRTLINLRSLLHIIDERTKPETQYETRCYGNIFKQIVKDNLETFSRLYFKGE
jgi:thymidylate synthase (FAD)